MKRIIDILNGKNKKTYHFHFVGIGGVSMHSLAIYIKNLKIGNNKARNNQKEKRIKKLQKKA